MKRLRKQHGPHIRFYHCGEYGEKTNRPHYHAILFNFDFSDKVHYKTNNGHKYYISDNLSLLWPHGFSVVGDVTFESAAYVARYCMKKVTGKAADDHYERITDNGEIVRIKSEYATMSRRPGIGHGWYKKFQTDVFPSDFVVHDGIKMKPPKYYDRQLEIQDEPLSNKLRALRKQSAAKKSADNTPERLSVRHKVQLSQAKRLKRGMENDE